MQRSDCFVSVVAPLSNDAAIIEAFVVETMDVLRAHYANYELVLVDDGSTDETMTVLGRLLTTHECIRVIRLSRRFGTEIAIASGLDAVIGDFVVVMLPDSGPVRLIPEVIRQAQAGQDVVFGVRRSRVGEPVWWRIGSRFFYWVSTRLVGLDLPQDATEFQVLSRRAVNAIIQIKDKYRYLRILSAYVGYANRGFVYEPVSRYGRPKRKGIAEGLNLAIGIIATNSTRPLRFVGLLAAGASVLSGAYFAYAVLISLLGWRGAEGVTALTLLNTGVFCLILGALAVLAEYVGRILDESRDRPLYYVLEERSSSVLLADTYRRNVVTESQSASDPHPPDPVRTPTR